MRVLLLLLALVAVPAVAKEDSCIVVCVSNCVTQSMARIAKFMCGPEASDMCFQKFGVCEKAGTDCAWRRTPELLQCLKEKDPALHQGLMQTGEM